MRALEICWGDGKLLFEWHPCSRSWVLSRWGLASWSLLVCFTWCGAITSWVGERTFRLPVFSACHIQGRASIPWVALGQKKGTSPLRSVYLRLNHNIRQLGTGGETLKSCSFWEEGPLTGSWGERESCVLDLQQSGVECLPYWAGRREGRNSLNSNTADFHIFTEFSLILLSSLKKIIFLFVLMIIPRVCEWLFLKNNFLQLH